MRLARQRQEEEELRLATANKLIASSISADLIRYCATDRWNGRYPRMVLSGESTGGLILSLPDLAGESGGSAQSSRR